ncbi:MAG TPA: c-type cytochrome [Polyangiaceae bacterium]|nr:c-type cytochrome [Polyangiaceae bacterium]
MLELFRRLFALPRGASSVAAGVDWLHFLVIGTTLLGALGIGVLATALIIRNRNEARGGATPRIAASRREEALVIAGILGLFCAFWLIGFRQYLEMQRPPSGARRVYVTAKQWMWKFTDIEGRSSNDVLTVEVGAKVELLMTSRDVIHSFFVPAFRLKRDVVPGRYTAIWFQPVETGEFPIYCAEYCGVAHSNMAGVVRVLSSADYGRWLQGAEPSKGQSLAEVGREAAVRHACFACHTVDGQPHIGPTWSGLYGSTVELADGHRVIADAAYLTRSMMEPSAELVAGYPPVMPTYLGSVSQPETAALIEYIRSLQHTNPAPSVTLPRLVSETARAADAPSNPAPRGGPERAP